MESVTQYMPHKSAESNDTQGQHTKHLTTQRLE